MSSVLAFSPRAGQDRSHRYMPAPPAAAAPSAKELRASVRPLGEIAHTDDDGVPVGEAERAREDEPRLKSSTLVRRKSIQRSPGSIDLNAGPRYRPAMTTKQILGRLPLTASQSALGLGRGQRHADESHDRAVAAGAGSGPGAGVAEPAASQLRRRRHRPPSGPAPTRGVRVAPVGLRSCGGP